MRKKLIKICMHMMVFLLSFHVFAQGTPEVVLTAVNPVSDELTLTNIGTASIDIANYQLCTDGFRYDAVSELRGVGNSILDTDLEAGESITLVWDEIGAVNGNGNATLILFSSANFGSSSPSILLDYVRWGTSNFRINQGVASGRWNNASASITCPAPYRTEGVRGGNPIAWGDADGGTISMNVERTTALNVNGATRIDGDLAVSICVDGRPDPIAVSHVTQATDRSYLYVITDNSDEETILNIVSENEISLDGAGAGTCKIWGWSYSGLGGRDGAFATFGGGPLQAMRDANCSSVSEQFITVVREEAIGGTVSIDTAATSDASGTTTINSATSATIVVGDAIANPIVVSHENAGAENLSYRYVITDAATGLILNVVNTNTIDLNGVSAGTCEIWGWSYRGVPGNGLDQVGMPLSSLDNLDCSDISDNQITLERVAEAAVAADPVFTSLNPATDEVTITNIGGSSVDIGAYQLCTTGFVYASIGSLTTESTVLSAGGSLTVTWSPIPSEAGGTLILFTNRSFGSTDPEVLRDYVRWGTTNNFRTSNGVASGRWSNDTESITCPAPYRTDGVRGGNPIAWGDADGGTISMNVERTTALNVNGTTRIDGDLAVSICVDGRPDPIAVSHVTQATERSYLYVITDNSDEERILNIVSENEISLDGAGAGTCKIWGWSYSGLGGRDGAFATFGGGPLQAMRDANCSSVSEQFITVVREEAIGGTVSIDTAATSDASGTTTINSATSATIVVGDAIANPIVVSHENAGAENLSYRYVITDAATGLILNVVNTNTIDLNGVSAGTCEIWGWSYRGVSGNGLDQVGMPLSSLDNLDCSVISDNQITVERVNNPLFTWTGASNNDWHTASNWSTNSVPSTIANITIPNGLVNYPTASIAVTFNSLIINSGASFIPEGTVTGSVTYKRNLPTTNWYLVGSPVEGETQQDIIANHTLATGSGSNIGIAPYSNETGAPWLFANSASTGDLPIGKGISIKLATAGDVSFTGNAVSSDVSYPLNEGARNSFNLLGNPYTSYINSSALATNNTAILSEQTVWLWDGSQYVTYNNINSIEIAPAQGFFVDAISDNNITYEASNRSHQNTDTFRKQVPHTSFELFIENDTHKRGTKVFYVDGKTTGFDNGYDSKIFDGITTNFGLYTELLANNEGKKLAIQTLPNKELQNMIIPVGVYAKANQEIVFSLNTVNFSSDIQILLEDRLTNTFTRLDEPNSNYTIVLEDDLNNTGRFYIHTNIKSVLSTESLNLDNVNIYKTADNVLKIKGLESGDTAVQLFTATGKQVLNTSLKTDGVIELKETSFLSSGVYIVKLQSSKGVITKKIVLN